MRNTIISLTAALLLSGTFLATDAFAQRRDRDRDDDRRQWVDLGCQQVSFRGRDRDTIRVGRREGRFRAIRLAARGNDVEVLRLSVVYGNGNPDELDVQRVIRSGDRTEAIDLKGRDRAIERIDVTYRQRPNFSGRATVCAQGMLG
jgi:Protein of unknown function (DUF2541)